MKSMTATEAPNSSHTPPPPSTRPVGHREIALLFVAATFASQMFNLADAAVLCGAAAVIVWSLGMIRPPRISWQATAAIGGGLVATFMWWPNRGWVGPAIALLWIGFALIVVSIVMWVIQRRATTSSTM